MATPISSCTAIYNAVVYASNRQDRLRSARSVPSRGFDRENGIIIIINNNPIIARYLTPIDRVERRASLISLDDSRPPRPVCSIGRSGSNGDEIIKYIEYTISVYHRIERPPT